MEKYILREHVSVFISALMENSLPRIIIEDDTLSIRYCDSSYEHVRIISEPSCFELLDEILQKEKEKAKAKSNEPNEEE